MSSSQQQSDSLQDSGQELNLSPSHSLSPQAYLRLLGLGLPVLIVCVCGINFFSLFVSQPLAYQRLYQYQLQKLKTATDVEIVLVGDSSLGNGIDAEVFSQGLGRQCLNLALTGSYGFAGSYNLIKTATEIQPINTVIVVQTPGLMQLPVSYNGYFFSTERFQDFLELNFQELKGVGQAFLDALLSIDYAEESIKHWIGARSNPPLSADYIAQNTPLNTAETPAPFAEIWNEEKLHFLHKISMFCRDHQLKLIYLHGPLWQQKAVVSERYLQGVNERLEKVDMQFLSNPILLTDPQVGDSDNHVHPDFKKQITEKYLELIRPALNRSSATSEP